MEKVKLATFSHPGWNIAYPPGAKIIQAKDVVPLPNHSFSEVRTQKASTSGNKHIKRERIYVGRYDSLKCTATQNNRPQTLNYATQLTPPVLRINY